MASADELTIIDWDDVWTGRLEWELAYVLHTFVPMWPDALSDEETVRRASLFAESYGLETCELRRVLELVPTRCRVAGDANRSHAAAGDPTFIRSLEEGIDKVWLDSGDHVAKRLPGWLRHLR